MDDKRIASEEDLLTIDASTGEKTYRYITREDVNHLEAETIHMREVAQKAIDEINWEIGHRRSPLQYLFPVYRILCANLDVYRQLARELRSRAYVTLYDIYDTRVEQMWRAHLHRIRGLGTTRPRDPRPRPTRRREAGKERAASADHHRRHRDERSRTLPHSGDAQRQRGDHHLSLHQTAV